MNVEINSSKDLDKIKKHNWGVGFKSDHKWSNIFPIVFEHKWINYDEHDSVGQYYTYNKHRK